MFVVVPAFLKDPAGEERLRRTLSRFPSASSPVLVLVTQGRQFVGPSLPRSGTIIHEHFDNPIGKWAAIRRGLSLIPSGNDGPVLLLDGDDPITDASMADVFAAASLRPDFLIGDRKEILLQADDQSSPQSRIFVEIFSNTLLLLILDSAQRTSTLAPDIQSGLYLLSDRARRAIRLEYVHDYGGELALYYELINAGFRSSNLSIEINQATPSAYSIDKILRSIARLPFFKSISSEKLLQALELAPNVYARFLEPNSQSSFEAEMSSALRAVFSNSPLTFGFQK